MILWTHLAPTIHVHSTNTNDDEDDDTDDNTNHDVRCMGGRRLCSGTRYKSGVRYWVCARVLLCGHVCGRVLYSRFTCTVTVSRPVFRICGHISWFRYFSSHVFDGVVFRSIGRCCSTEVGSGTSRVCPALPEWRTPWVTWLDWSGFIVTSLKWDSVISSVVPLVSHDSATSGVVMTSFPVDKSPCDMSVVDVVIAAVKNSSVKFYKIRKFLFTL